MESLYLQNINYKKAEDNRTKEKRIKDMVLFLLENADNIQELGFTCRMKKVGDSDIDKEGNPCDMFRFLSMDDEYELMVFFRLMTDECFAKLSEIEQKKAKTLQSE